MAELTKGQAEALGWTFDEGVEKRTVEVDVPLYNASKFVGSTYLSKTFEDEGALLASIAAWEAAQPAPAAVDETPDEQPEPDEPVSGLSPDPVPEAPADEPATVAAEASAAPAEDASETALPTATEGA